MPMKTEIARSESCNGAKRRWIPPELVAVKDASSSELLLSGPIDDGGFLTS